MQRSTMVKAWTTEVELKMMSYGTLPMNSTEKLIISSGCGKPMTQEASAWDRVPIKTFEQIRQV